MLAIQHGLPYFSRLGRACLFLPIYVSPSVSVSLLFVFEYRPSEMSSSIRDS